MTKKTPVTKGQLYFQEMQVRELEHDLGFVTKLLRQACQRMVEHKTKMPKEVRAWWVAHHGIDDAG